ncbi:hypothetical protein ACFVWG_10840 [Kribbella sp. NPDC058245]|uniref:hypothetical protein n=1 Tax=Kribbella sp. NPDC058245 TaxID=3346399 RepID=UPI0036E93CE3
MGARSDSGSAAAELQPKIWDGKGADGNPFTVYYQDGRWDYVNAHSLRPLDTKNLVTRITVWC